MIDWYARPSASPGASPTDQGNGLEPEPLYFPISVTKLSVLCICTLGLYQLYWFFRSWQFVTKERGRGRIVGPLLRTIFGVLFCYPLFQHIERTARQVGSARLRAGWMAVLWIVLTLSHRLPDPYWFVNTASFVPVLFVQRVVNDINAERNATPARTGFSAWELLVCALGLGIGALGLFGFLYYELVPPDDY